MEDKVIKIACIGDSITYGLTLDDRESESYPAVLEMMAYQRGDSEGGRRISYEVGNLGVSGTGLWRHGLYRYTTTMQYDQAVRWGADIIVICLGTNDAIQMIDSTFEKEFVEDYMNLVASLKGSSPGAKVFIAKAPPVPGMPSIAPAVCKINSLVTRAAKECHATLIDLSEPFQGRDDLFSDGVHPNKDGARLIASVVYKVLFGEENADNIGFMEDLYKQYSAEHLLSIDTKRMVTDEEEALGYLDTFFNVMEKPGIDPDSVRSLLHNGRKLLLLPTVRAAFEDDLAEKAVSVITDNANKGDLVFVTFASWEDDWRLEGIQYEGFHEIVMGSVSLPVTLLFGTAIPDDKAPYARPLQASIMILGNRPLEQK